MRPYYEESGYKIFCGDCREVLPRLTLESHAIVSDPPYGIAYSPGGGGRGWFPRGKTFTGQDLIAGDDVPFEPQMLLSHGKLVLWGGQSLRQPPP